MFFRVAFSVRFIENQILKISVPGIISDGQRGIRFGTRRS